MLKVPLIGDKKPVSNIIIRISWIIAGLSGFSLGFFVKYEILLKILGSIFFVSFFICLIGNLFFKKYIIIGDIEISEFSLKIINFRDKMIFDLLKITDLTINYFGARGDSYGFFVGSMLVNDGSKNYISFEYEGLKYKYGFLVNSKHFLRIFYKYVKAWKDNGIDIKIFRNKMDITSKFLSQQGKF